MERGGRVDRGAFVLARGDGVLVRLRIPPGAKRTSVRGKYGGGAIKLAAAAPPGDGKASAGVQRFLARLPDAPRSEVEAVRGSSSRDKTVFVGGIDAARARKMLPGEAS